MRSWLLVLASLVVLGGCQLLGAPEADGPAFELTPVVGASDDELGEARSVIEERLAAADVPSVVTSAPGSILVRLEDPEDLARAQRLSTAPGRIDFVPVPPEYGSQVVDGQPLPVGMDATPLFTGDRISELRRGETALGDPAIDFQLDEQAARIFDDHAATHQGQRFAIVLDGRVISAPMINVAQFNGRGQVSGNLSLEAMDELIAIAAGGPLPIDLEVATVGEASAAR
jgi:preprotein translocase subunit SecD